ncbi:MAG: hypothetical protein ACR2MO_11080 [Acidimicrobiales bacterium]
MTDAAQGPAGGAPGDLSAWLARLGPLATGRPPPSIGQAVAGAGGALVAAGAVALGGQRWSSSGSAGLGVILTAAVLVAGLAVMARLPPPVAVAGVGASGVAAPALAFFVSAGGGFPSLREVAILAAILLAALYALGPWRGHTFHLTILVVAGWVLALSVGGFGLERSFFGGFATVGDAFSTAGAASMVLGVIYLGLGSWLHDGGLEGMATPFLGVAALALPAGAFAVVRDLPDAGQGVVALAVGAAVALVGARCRRRGTTWFGLAVAVFGVLALADSVSDRTGVVAVVVVLAGAGLVYLAPLVAALVGEPSPVAPSGVPTAPPPAPDAWPVVDAPPAAAPAVAVPSSSGPSDEAWSRPTAPPPSGPVATQPPQSEADPDPQPEPDSQPEPAPEPALESASEVAAQREPESASEVAAPREPESASEVASPPAPPASPPTPRVRRPRTTRPPGSPRSPQAPPAAEGTPRPPRPRRPEGPAGPTPPGDDGTPHPPRRRPPGSAGRPPTAGEEP